MIERTRMRRLVRTLSVAVMRRYMRWSLRITVEGLEHLPRSGGAVVIANHACALDGWLMVCAIPRMMYFFTLARFFANPVAAWYGRMMGAVPDHGGADRSATLAVGETVLAAGGLLLSFPEGNVNPTPGELRTFKNGFLLLAQRCGVPVVPVAIIGSERALRDPQRPRGLRGWRLRPAQIRIVVMEPVASPPIGDDRQAFEHQREHIRQIIADTIREGVNSESR